MSAKIAPNGRFLGFYAADGGSGGDGGGNWSPVFLLQPMSISKNIGHKLD